MKFLMGKKIEMTQIFTEDGQAVAVTKVQAGPCTVVQIKSDEKDGYSAVQFGYGEKKEKNINKPQLGHMKGLGNFRYLRELRIKPSSAKATADKNDKDKTELKKGDQIDVSSFAEGDKIEVTSSSKGRGFQGVVKRHGFHGSLATHGHKDQLRMPGSIGATGPAHVFKGTKMGGHMGDDQVTIKNLKVIQVDEENNILYIKGGISGARNGLVIIKGEGEMSKVESPSPSAKATEDKKSESLKSEEAKEEKVEEKKFASAEAIADKEEIKEETKEEKVESKDKEEKEQTK